MVRSLVLDGGMHLTGRSRPLTRADYDQLVTRDTMGVLPDGTVKFLYLRGVIPRRTTGQLFRTLNTLPFHSVRQSRRAAVRASPLGGELAFGWVDRRPYGIHLLAPTQRQVLTCHYELLPLLQAMNNLMAEHLPAHWQAQAQAAHRNGHRTLGAEWMNPNGGAVYRPQLLGNDRWLPAKPPIFSTITINRNVVCGLHCDGGNVEGMACLTAVGQWQNTELCFPQLAVAFPMRPGDVLMADTGTEPHGNVGPFMGTRISVVAYLRRLTAPGYG